MPILGYFNSPNACIGLRHVLAGAGAGDQIVRCRTPEEILRVFNGLSELATCAFPSSRIVLAVPRGTESATIEQDIRQGGLRLFAAEVVEPLQNPLRDSCKWALDSSHKAGNCGCPRCY